MPPTTYDQSDLDAIDRVALEVEALLNARYPNLCREQQQLFHVVNGLMQVACTLVAITAEQPAPVLEQMAQRIIENTPFLLQTRAAMDTAANKPRRSTDDHHV